MLHTPLPAPSAHTTFNAAGHGAESIGGGGEKLARTRAPHPGAPGAAHAAWDGARAPPHLRGPNAAQRAQHGAGSFTPAPAQAPLPAWVTDRSDSRAAESCATGYNPLFQVGSGGTSTHGSTGMHGAGAGGSNIAESEGHSAAHGSHSTHRVEGSTGPGPTRVWL